MYYVMYGEWGDCYGEYASYEEAEEVFFKLSEEGEDAWICSDDDEPSDADLECGFDPYEGGYTFDC